MHGFCIQCSGCGWTAPLDDRSGQILNQLEGKETFQCPGCGAVGRVRP